MNILFVLTKESTKDPYEYTFTLKLIEHLARGNHTRILVGPTVVSSISAEISIPDLAETEGAINKIDFNQWDVVIVSNAHLLSLLGNNLQMNSTCAKIVYVCHAKDYHGISGTTNNILLSFNIMVPGTREWLPPEKNRYLLKPLFDNIPADRVAINNDGNKVNAVHFISETDRQLSVVKSVIVAVNCLFNIELTIVAPAHVIPILKTIVNRNINFIEQELWYDERIRDFTLAITSEYHAVKTAYYKIPTLVAGTRGLGGWVTTDNIYEHIKNHFQGRIGGELAEFIPPMGIIELIMGFHETRDHITAEASKVATIITDEFAAAKTFGVIESEINTHLKKYSSISSGDNYALKPYKMSGSRVVTDQTNGAYLLDGNNKVIRAVAPSEAFLLAQCNGERSLTEIIQESRSGDPAQVRTFFLDLWKRDILSFRQ